MSSLSETSAKPLRGVVVVDFSSSVAGQYAGRMLAMHGADVTLVEDATGSATRHRMPRSADGVSFLYRHLNQGKHRVEAGGEAVTDLVAKADVVIRDAEAGLPSLPETTIDCVVGEFPSGPYAGWKGSEMVHQALSGVMAATGDPDREPIYGVGDRASYAAGTAAYVSIVSALYERRRSGRGQQVGTTVYEAAASMGQNIVSRGSYNGSQERRGKYAGFLATLRCKDAWVVLFALSDWAGLCRTFHREDLIDDPRFATSGGRLAHWDEILGVLQGGASLMFADDLVAACQASRLSAEKIGSLADVVDSEHWVAREMLRDVGGDSEYSEVAMHRLFVMAGADVGVPSPSPRLQKVGA